MFTPDKLIDILITLSYINDYKNYQYEKGHGQFYMMSHIQLNLYYRSGYSR